jgi:hypothetical protein
MTMKSSLLAASLLAVGLSFAGQAMAGQYSETASQRIAEANRAAAEPQVPGVFAQQPPIADSDVLKDMVQYDAASAKQTASSGANQVKLENGGEVGTSTTSND